MSAHFEISRERSWGPLDRRSEYNAKERITFVLTPTKPGLPGSFTVACGAALAVRAETTMSTGAVIEIIII